MDSVFTEAMRKRPRSGYDRPPTPPMRRHDALRRVLKQLLLDYMSTSGKCPSAISLLEAEASIKLTLVTDFNVSYKGGFYNSEHHDALMAAYFELLESCWERYGASRMICHAHASMSHPLTHMAAAGAQPPNRSDAARQLHLPHQ